MRPRRCEASRSPLPVGTVGLAAIARIDRHAHHAPAGDAASDPAARALPQLSQRTGPTGGAGSAAVLPMCARRRAFSSLSLLASRRVEARSAAIAGSSGERRPSCSRSAAFSVSRLPSTDDDTSTSGARGQTASESQIVLPARTPSGPTARSVPFVWQAYCAACVTGRRWPEPWVQARGQRSRRTLPAGDGEGALHSGFAVSGHRAVAGVGTGRERDGDVPRPALEHGRLTEDLVRRVGQHHVVRQRRGVRW